MKSKSRDYHYIGHSSDVRSRLKAHNYGKVRSTRPYRPFEVIYKEEFPDRSSAFKREMYLKSGEGNIWIWNRSSVKVLIFGV